jgi:hypothetical protein
MGVIMRLEGSFISVIEFMVSKVLLPYLRCFVLSLVERSGTLLTILLRGRVLDVHRGRFTIAVRFRVSPTTKGQRIASGFAGENG